MTRKPIPAPATADVIDLAARRRCALERAGHDPVSVAVGMLADTGQVPGWDFTTDPDDGSGWAA
ncbi:hypothetical protein HGA13_12735 [Nocardia speluncae]|uniref:Uncharacterized protein n=1 Tax=Nocardia speluncae TaxID=419477 RepID=A0A846XEY0_9NOCA|nr:hypothetical protein [Nocardia speluncae]NKY33935.1 hypothetical protein [Nocardia speluncae]